MLPEQKSNSDLGGTLRLRAYPYKHVDGKNTKEVYDNPDMVEESHRHLHEFNNDYCDQLEETG